MNRLIIIGNGFDIAHGMPTKYSDFVKWYLISIFKAVEANDFADDAIEVKFRRLGMIYEKYECAQIIDSVNKNINYNILLEILENNNLKNDRIPFIFNFKFPFVKEICKIFVEKNWVDIENLFYQRLLQLSKIQDNEEARNNAVDLLNEGMDYLKNKLEEYLSTLPPAPMNFDILKIFKADFNNAPNLMRKSDSGLILNFNYTKTINNYLQNLSSYYFNNIFIHGEVKNKYNPLVFGFGDEMDDHYKILEKANYNGFLDNMKSFGYFKTGNYQQVASFINSNEDFEVFVMGHSCGLSDRVMLNMIFEHQNCKSIKIFYHGDKKNNNYKTLTQEISRHFNKKNEMRLKLVPFEDSIPLPQSN